MSRTRVKVLWILRMQSTIIDIREKYYCYLFGIRWTLLDLSTNWETDFFFQKFWTKLKACWRHGSSVWLLKKGSVTKIQCYLKFSRSVRINVSQFQRAKKVVSDSPWLVDFAIELVNFCPTGRWSFWRNSNNRINAYQNFFFRPSWNDGFLACTCQLQLAEWQAVKLTFFLRLEISLYHGSLYTMPLSRTYELLSFA